jgi:hypothetical protein
VTYHISLPCGLGDQGCDCSCHDVGVGRMSRYFFRPHAVGIVDAGQRLTVSEMRSLIHRVVPWLCTSYKRVIHRLSKHSTGRCGPWPWRMLTV